MNFDFVIIGGGIAGLSAAAELAPFGSTLLIEREDHLSLHSTGRSAAIFCDTYGDEVIQSLSAFSRPLIDVHPDSSMDRLLHPRGIVHLVQLDEQYPAPGERLSELDRLTPKETRAFIPDLLENAIQGALYEPSAADIDVAALVELYRKDFKQNGGVLKTGIKLAKARHKSSHWVLDTNIGKISAGVVVNAAGGWSGEVAACFGLSDPGLHVTSRSAALVPAYNGRDVGGWPMAVNLGETVYFKPEAGQLMISPADENPVNAHDAYGDDFNIAVAIDLFQKLVDWDVTRVSTTWGGLRTLSPDGRPIVGPDPSATEFYWLAGQGGFGIQAAPAMARLLCNLILDKSQEGSLGDLVAPLDPRRFQSR